MAIDWIRLSLFYLIAVIGCWKMVGRRFSLPDRVDIFLALVKTKHWSWVMCVGMSWFFWLCTIRSGTFPISFGSVVICCYRSCFCFVSCRLVRLGFPSGHGPIWAWIHSERSSILGEVLFWARPCSRRGLILSEAPLLPLFGSDLLMSTLKVPPWGPIWAWLRFDRLLGVWPPNGHFESASPRVLKISVYLLWHLPSLLVVP